MTESDIISKLKSLKFAEPEETWVVENRARILSKAPVYVVANTEQAKRNRFIGLYSAFDVVSGNLMTRKLASSMASVAFIALIGSFFAVTAAKSSLPGDPLYSVKLANENIVLAVSSNEGDKAKIEIEQAGKRLEELTAISKNSSDVGQQEKVEQLVANFEQKVNSAQTRMAKINDSEGKKGVASVARVINIQSEKYSDVLAKTSDNLPTVIQDKVSGKLASAINNNEKLNTKSLLIIIENKDEVEGAMSDDEIVEKLKKKMDKIGDDSTKRDLENKASDDNSAEASEGDILKTDEMSGINASSPKEIVSSIAADAKNSEAAEAPSSEDIKKTLIESANTSIENKDIEGAAKNLGEILAIDEKIASDDKASTDATQPVDGTSTDGADDSRSTEETDTAEESNGDSSGSDTKKIDLSPSVNVIQ